MKAPEEYNRIMVEMFGAPKDLLSGKLMRVCVPVRQELPPGERVEVASLPMEVEFQLDYVIVPREVAYDPCTNEPRLFFHHDRIAVDFWEPGSGKRIPASFILCPQTEQMQMLDLYPKRLYKPCEVVVLGTFENVGATPLLLRAVLVGKAVDARVELSLLAKEREICRRQPPKGNG